MRRAQVAAQCECEELKNMKITITGRNMKVGARLNDRIEKKLAKMSKYFKDDVIFSSLVKDTPEMEAHIDEIWADLGFDF
jgi:ribosome-associated translation inhibitor RaiA